jgi:hypothetical protein
MKISAGSLVKLHYIGMYLERYCKFYQFGIMLWKRSCCIPCNMDGYWRGTEKHLKKTEFHILHPPPRMKPNIYRVQAKGLIATRTVGKQFLKYFRWEDQREDYFLKLRKKY